MTTPNRPTHGSSPHQIRCALRRPGARRPRVRDGPQPPGCGAPTPSDEHLMLPRPHEPVRRARAGPALAPGARKARDQQPCRKANPPRRPHQIPESERDERTVAAPRPRRGDRSIRTPPTIRRRRARSIVPGSQYVISGNSLWAATNSSSRASGQPNAVVASSFRFVPAAPLVKCTYSPKLRSRA